MHRALQIIDAVAAAISAQSSLGAAVFTNRTLSLSGEDQEIPAVCVNMGPDEPTESQFSTIASFDSQLTLKVIIYSQEASQAEVVTQLMRLRVSVQKAMYATPLLGLSWVLEVGYGGASEPEHGDTGAPLAGRMECSFTVLYQFDLDDPE